MRPPFVTLTLPNSYSAAGLDASINTSPARGAKRAVLARLAKSAELLTAKPAPSGDSRKWPLATAGAAPAAGASDLTDR
jgi:hypothetical protein